MKTTKFNFYGFEVEVNCKNQKIIDLLELDFRYFNRPSLVKSQLKLNIYLQDDISTIIPKGLVANKQSINSMTFDEGSTRYNDYYGEVVSVFDYKNEKASIYGKDVNSIHEIAYLIILSRQGKWCDRNGLHKVHAMCVSKNNKSMILMLPMKGGKTTLFTRFLNRKEVSLVSDDSPVIDLYGNLHAFPIRFGVEPRPMYDDIIKNIPSNFKSTLQRKQYGEKVLVDLTFYGDRVGDIGEKIILVQGKRHNSDKTIIKKVSFFLMYKYLVTNLVVGIGLPMIIEYFLESSLRDKVTNLKILISRALSAFFLCAKSEKYLVFMGTDIEANAREIEELFN